MTLGVFDRQKETARAKIAKYGQVVDLVTYADPVPPDGTKPWDVADSVESVQSVSALFLAFDQALVNGTTIHEGDRKVYVAAKGLASPPVLNGALRIAGETWQIVRVEPFSPNGEDILYTLQVRE